jgi:hypothetical protein
MRSRAPPSALRLRTTTPLARTHVSAEAAAGPSAPAGGGRDSSLKNPNRSTRRSAARPRRLSLGERGVHSRSSSSMGITGPGPKAPTGRPLRTRRTRPSPISMAAIFLGKP